MSAVDEIEQALSKVASHLADKATADGTDIQDGVKVLKELREIYAILTATQGSGDKGSGRRSTIGDMRKKIALVSNREEEDGGADEVVPDSGD